MPISRMTRGAGKATTKTASNKKSATRLAGKTAAKIADKSARPPRSKAKFQTMQSPPDAERYALALESINENLYDWDIENDTVYFAPGLFKILGLKAEHMRRPSDWTDRVHPDDRPLFKYTLAEHLKGKTPRFTMELRYRDGSGNWRWARQAGIALRRPDGYAYRMVGAAGDITETKHLDEALVASADVLKVMSRATFELQTVLDAVVQAAVRLCEADAALIFRREGDHYRLAAEKGLNPKQKDFLRDEKIPLTRKTMVGRTAIERRVIHVPDITADTEYNWPEVHQVADFRTIVGVPLLRDGEPVGVITLTRSVGRPFGARQLELISTFADQAVIAIETVRLFGQVQERRRETERTRSILATMIDNMDDGIALMTPEGDDVRVHFVNNRMMEFQNYPKDVAYPESLLSDIRRFQAKRGDFGPVPDIEAKVRQEVAAHAHAGRRALRAALGQRPLHRGELQDARQRHDHQHPPRHHGAEGTRERTRRRQGGSRNRPRRRRKHAAGDADRARQHERGRSAVRQGFQHRVRQPQALRLPPLHARDRRARRLRLRRPAVHGGARRLRPRRRHREDHPGTRRTHPGSEWQPPRAAHRQRRPRRVHVQPACLAAGCSRSATTSPRSSTARRRCVRRRTS